MKKTFLVFVLAFCTIITAEVQAKVNDFGVGEDLAIKTVKNERIAFCFFTKKEKQSVVTSQEVVIEQEEEIRTFNYLKSDNSDDILQMYLKDIGKKKMLKSIQCLMI